MHAHFDCFSGAAGDMLLASLIDAADGDPETFAQDLVRRMKRGIPDIAEEWDVTTKRVVRSTGCIAARKVDVLSVFGHQSAPVPGSSSSMAADQREHNHEHSHGHSHGHNHSHNHNHNHEHSHDHNHEHSHDHNHEHSHDHTAHNGGASPLRNLPEITRLITSADPTYIPHAVQRRTISAFTALAHAEAKTHGATSIDHVHFHEVGAIDSIVDTLGTILALHTLGVETVSCSKLPLGEGTVMTQHGLLPVPAPAALRLMVGMRCGTCPGPPGVTGELVTPTAAALLRALTEDDGDSSSNKGSSPPHFNGRAPAMVLHRVGLGAGSKDFPGHANVVRVLIGERAEGSRAKKNHHQHQHQADTLPSLLPKEKEKEEDDDEKEEESTHLAQPNANDVTTTISQTDTTSWNVQTLTLFAANIDDTTPEVLSYTMNQLLAAGAVDAWVYPIVMKKGRSAHCINCLIVDGGENDRKKQKLEGEILQILFRETSTLGIRIQRNIERAALSRSFVSVKIGDPTANRTVKVKIGRMIGTNEASTISAEYEDCRAVAEETGVPLKVVMDQAVHAARVKLAGLEN